MYVKSATLEKLLLKVVDNYCTDDNLVETFLVMHPYVIEPVKLLKRFAELYLYFRTESDPSHWKYVKRIHLLGVMERWLILNQRFKEDTDFVDSLNNFLEDNLKKNSSTFNAVSSLDEGTDTDSISESLVKSPRSEPVVKLIDEEIKFIESVNLWIKTVNTQKKNFFFLHSSSRKITATCSPDKEGQRILEVQEAVRKPKFPSSKDRRGDVCEADDSVGE